MKKMSISEQRSKYWIMMAILCMIATATTWLAGVPAAAALMDLAGMICCVAGFINTLRG